MDNIELAKRRRRKITKQSDFEVIKNNVENNIDKMASQGRFDRNKMEGQPVVGSSYYANVTNLPPITKNRKNEKKVVKNYTGTSGALERKNNLVVNEPNLLSLKHSEFNSQVKYPKIETSNYRIPNDLQKNSNNRSKNNNNRLMSNNYRQPVGSSYFNNVRKKIVPQAESKAILEEQKLYNYLSEERKKLFESYTTFKTLKLSMFNSAMASYVKSIIMLTKAVNKGDLDSNTVQEIDKSIKESRELIIGGLEKLREIVRGMADFYSNDLKEIEKTIDEQAEVIGQLYLEERNSKTLTSEMQKQFKETKVSIRIAKHDMEEIAKTVVGEFNELENSGIELLKSMPFNFKYNIQNNKQKKARVKSKRGKEVLQSRLLDSEKINPKETGVRYKEKINPELDLDLIEKTKLEESRVKNKKRGKKGNKKEEAKSEIKNDNIENDKIKKKEIPLINQEDLKRKIESIEKKKDEAEFKKFFEFLETKVFTNEDGNFDSKDLHVDEFLYIMNMVGKSKTIKKLVELEKKIYESEEGSKEEQKFQQEELDFLNENNIDSSVAENIGAILFYNSINNMLYKDYLEILRLEPEQISADFNKGEQGINKDELNELAEVIGSSEPLLYLVSHLRQIEGYGDARDQKKMKLCVFLHGFGRDADGNFDKQKTSDDLKLLKLISKDDSIMKGICDKAVSQGIINNDIKSKNCWFPNLYEEKVIEEDIEEDVNNIKEQEANYEENSEKQDGKNGGEQGGENKEEGEYEENEDDEEEEEVEDDEDVAEELNKEVDKNEKLEKNELQEQSKKEKNKTDLEKEANSLEALGEDLDKKEKAEKKVRGKK